MQGPPIFSIDVLNFALITHSVPAERVEAHLPPAYVLDSHEGPSGREAFVSATCFCNLDFRVAGLNAPRHTFNESTYRTYVTHKGRAGVYFFGRYVGTQRSWIAQRPLARDTFTAGFDIAIERAGHSYRSYACRAASDRGVTEFVLRAAEEPTAQGPFATGEELAQFLTYRLHGFYTSSVGLQGHMPVSHPRMRPLAGRLEEGRFDLWSELGIVLDREILEPLSVMVIPRVPFRLYAPRPLV